MKKDSENNRVVNGQVAALEKQLRIIQEKVAQQHQQILAEKQKCEDLLHNMLPDEIYRELLKNGKVAPQSYSNVTVMFTDFMDFTSMCEHIELKELIQELDMHFSRFDEICEKHYLEKIKTIGDAYMCVGGMPMRNRSHPFDAILAAMDILQYIKDVNEVKKRSGECLWNLRIGIHTGPVIAGVVGKNKFLYDIWGDTVNVANRLEESGDAGKINISGSTFEYVKEYIECMYRGKIPVKHKGDIDMYFVEHFLPQYSDEFDNKKPNKNFKLAIGKL